MISFEFNEPDGPENEEATDGLRDGDEHEHKQIPMIKKMTTMMIVAKGKDAREALEPV